MLAKSHQYYGRSSSLESRLSDVRFFSTQTQVIVVIVYCHTQIVQNSRGFLPWLHNAHHTRALIDSHTHDSPLPKFVQYSFVAKTVAMGATGIKSLLWKKQLTYMTCLAAHVSMHQFLPHNMSRQVGLASAKCYQCLGGLESSLPWNWPLFSAPWSEHSQQITYIANGRCSQHQIMHNWFVEVKLPYTCVYNWNASAKANVCTFCYQRQVM